MTESLYIAHVAEDGGMLVSLAVADLAGPHGWAILHDLHRRASSLAAGNAEDWQPVGDGHVIVEARLDPTDYDAVHNG